jgi:hypothetical protein
VHRHWTGPILYRLRQGNNPQIHTDYYNKSDDSQSVLLLFSVLVCLPHFAFFHRGTDMVAPGFETMFKLSRLKGRQRMA